MSQAGGQSAGASPCGLGRLVGRNQLGREDNEKSAALGRPLELSVRLGGHCEGAAWKGRKIERERERERGASCGPGGAGG